jgi:NOL1/NOP2/sun family putative RNA methylase
MGRWASLPHRHSYKNPLPEALARLREAYHALTRNTRLVREAERLRQQHSWLHIHQALRYIALLGAEAENFLGTSGDTLMKTIRANTLKTTPAELAKRLREKGFHIDRHPYINYGLVVRKAPYSPGAALEYLLGYYTIQGPASMLAAPALEPLSNVALIVDMCSGAGVKTTQIAQHNPEAPIVAIDISRRKLAALKNNASRLAASNITAYHMDARQLPQRLRQKASHILLDAPCSGEGLIPYPKGRWPRSFKDILSRVTLQHELIAAAVEALQPGGTLVYSTCTISVEENEYVLSMFTLSGVLEPEEPPISGGDDGITEYLGLPIDERLKHGCRRFFPHRHRTEGFTICRLRRTEAAHPGGRAGDGRERN